MHYFRLPVENLAKSVAAIAVITTLLVTVAHTQVRGEPTGSVEGVVLDQQGHPLAGATVFVGTMLKGPSTRTSDDGKFVLNEVPAGKVGLNAYKEDDGHPYNMSSFYIVPGEIMPKVDVGAGDTVKGVTVQLGAKAAYLKLDVTDNNGMPVDARNLLLSRPDLGKFGDYQTSIPASKSIMVPPLPFRLAIQAEGYDTWHYEDGKGDLITLKSGETLKLHVQLRKSP